MTAVSGGDEVARDARRGGDAYVLVQIVDRGAWVNHEDMHEAEVMAGVAMRSPGGECAPWLFVDRVF